MSSLHVFLSLCNSILLNLAPSVLLFICLTRPSALHSNYYHHHQQQQLPSTILNSPSTKRKLFTWLRLQTATLASLHRRTTSLITITFSTLILSLLSLSLSLSLSLRLLVLTLIPFLLILHIRRRTGRRCSVEYRLSVSLLFVCLAR
ncbi:hypothetical protein BKA81DRAFT_165434 [Phyllosticta paracitricarpa]|uniref:Transmembrane protein n=1 Tax=Phyllosticta citricarpa TaxID=55181 RepID=A0ABR1LBJ1_9PEZI